MKWVDETVEHRRCSLKRSLRRCRGGKDELWAPSCSDSSLRVTPTVCDCIQDSLTSPHGRIKSCSVMTLYALYCRTRPSPRKQNVDVVPRLNVVFV